MKMFLFNDMPSHDRMDQDDLMERAFEKRERDRKKEEELEE